MVLSGAYVSSNRSLRNSRQAQERGAATKFAEAELDALKVNAVDKDIYNGTDTFCISAPPSSTRHNFTVLPIAADASTDNFADYPAECARTSYGAITYYTAVVRQSAETFAVYIRWDSASGKGRDEVKMFYRLSR